MTDWFVAVAVVVIIGLFAFTAFSIAAGVLG